MGRRGAPAGEAKVSEGGKRHREKDTEWREWDRRERDTEWGTQEGRRRGEGWGQGREKCREAE